jgi:hypothetical protein
MNAEHAGEVWARIEGKLDLLNERQSRSNDDIRDLRERANGHSNRLLTLEADKHSREGEAKGFDKAVRGIYALAVAAGLGSLAAIIKIFVPAVGG